MAATYTKWRSDVITACDFTTSAYLNTNYDYEFAPPPPPKPALFAEEYKWAVRHPRDKDAAQFLNLDWGGNLDRAKADFIAIKILKKMIDKQ
jgi:hypothetical protein